MYNRQFVNFIQHPLAEEGIGWYYTSYNPETGEGAGWFGSPDLEDVGNYWFRDVLAEDEDGELVLVESTCGFGAGCFWTI